MFGIFRKESESHSGNDTYRYVEPMLRKARELCIVSPYIDSYYARFLLGNLRGKKIYLISSSMDPRARALLAGKRDRTSLLVYAFIILALDYLSAATGIYLGYVLAASGVALAVIAYMLATAKRIKGLSIKVPSSFVHAKMYVSESTGIEGSANLTYKGMHSNIEHISITRSGSEVERLRKEFFGLWNSL